MTNERHDRYRQARDRIASVAAAKLQPGERELLEDCAEGLLLSASAEEAIGFSLSARQQLRRLVDSGRWLESSAQELADLIDSCGPQVLLAA